MTEATHSRHYPPKRRTGFSWPRRAGPHGLGRAILPRQGSLAQVGQMRLCLLRREFIALLGGAAAWPLAARAQQDGRVRRVGVLMPGDENDPVQKTRLSAFTQALADLDWTDGRNVRMDLVW